MLHLLLGRENFCRCWHMSSIRLSGEPVGIWTFDSQIAHGGGVEVPLSEGKFSLAFSWDFWKVLHFSQKTVWLRADPCGFRVKPWILVAIPPLAGLHSQWQFICLWRHFSDKCLRECWTMVENKGAVHWTDSDHTVNRRRFRLHCSPKHIATLLSMTTMDITYGLCS